LRIQKKSLPELLTNCYGSSILHGVGLSYSIVCDLAYGSRPDKEPKVNKNT